MDKPVRYTPEKQQELISRSQLSERLVEFGWIPSSPEDLGEDFIVQIYFQGQATGVSFYIQEKSVINLHERRRSEFLPYDFEVKDIKHWEKFVQPVVLVVWDVKLREGRWVLLKDAIKHVEQKHPKWRKQKNTRIYFPWNNTTDNKGLLKLQHNIGNSMFPLISKGKELSMAMTFGFPDSQRGRKNARSLETFIDKGGQVTLRETLLKELISQIGQSHGWMLNLRKSK